MAPLQRSFAIFDYIGIDAFITTIINLKYLFQLSFRLCHGLRERKVMEVRRTLNCPLDSSNEIALALDRSVRAHLHETANTFPVGEIERSVFSQVCTRMCIYMYVRIYGFC